MLPIGPELKRIIEAKHIIKKDIASQIGVTPTYISQIMQKESIDCALLDKICKVIGVPASHFFGETAQTNQANATTIIGNAEAVAGATPNEVATLRELLAEKERTIQILLSQIGSNTGQ